MKVFLDSKRTLQLIRTSSVIHLGIHNGDQLLIFEELLSTISLGAQIIIGLAEST